MGVYLLAIILKSKRGNKDEATNSNRKPQKTNIEMSKPTLVNYDSVNQAIKKKFNQWFQKVDENYEKLLNKRQLGEDVLFIGKKSVQRGSI